MKNSCSLQIFLPSPAERTKLYFQQKLYSIVKITMKAVGLFSASKTLLNYSRQDQMTSWNSSLLIKKRTIHNQCMNSNNTHNKMSRASNRYKIYYNLTSSNGDIGGKPSVWQWMKINSIGAHDSIRSKWSPVVAAVGCALVYALWNSKILVKKRFHVYSIWAQWEILARI